MLSSPAAALEPGVNKHQRMPIKSTDDDLCAWLRDIACLSEKIIGKVREKLDEVDVDTVQALRALHQMDGLGEVFTRVPAKQVADALDAVQAPPAPAPYTPERRLPPMDTDAALACETPCGEEMAPPPAPRKPDVQVRVASATSRTLFAPDRHATKIQAAWRGWDARVAGTDVRC